MRLDEGLDTGPTLLHRELPIGSNETASDLYPKLAHIGAALMVETLAALGAGTITPQPQDDTYASHAPILTRDDGRIDPARPAHETYNRWRGFQPWPGAWFLLHGRKLTVTHMAPGIAAHAGEPGTLLTSNGQLHLVCGHGTTVHLVEVQPEGKRRMPAADFLRGNPNAEDAHIG